MPLSLITIDFWNTLVDNTGGEGRNHQRAQAVIEEAHRLGHEVTEDQVRLAAQNAWTFFRQHWLELVRTPLTHEMVDHMWKELGIPEDEAGKGRVEEVFKYGILDHPPALLPGVKDALAHLSERFVLGIVSDTAISPGAILKGVLEKHGVLAYFSHFSFSDETGVAKPHPKAYTTILDAAGVSPLNALHVGDIERTDIAGARDLGMYAILYAGDHANSVVESDLSTTRANVIAHHWDEVKNSITSGHTWVE